ncbi:hypothetical protein AAT17_07380 [Nonlabens sp. MIC269]|uniref:TraB/GumN family protein n=1 Tax=Nonlabens sp. MIC269 TaxID=1476901 RepID=UPI00071EC8DD|nr:TraB/GumN family protein [Nonlabens sp. MIC269]ALM21056.1 hypothetical protein AAT17_07380 [Nonlabens sp. MIC269]
MKNYLWIGACLWCLLMTAQQEENSLLWKITGNGLEKPSYLYGTMHVSKKVAFRLDDVFYKALNESDAIALESDPTFWMGEYYEEEKNDPKNLTRGGYDDDFYEGMFKLGHPEPQLVRYSLRLGDEALNGFLYRKSNGGDNFEEETYLDLFIYQAGKKNNKPIISLEDFKESQYLTTVAGNSEPKKEVDKWLQERLENKNRYTLMEDVYRDRNISLLDSIGQATDTEYYREYMLYKRNQNMVDELIKSMGDKSIFAGVGAAHLPGEKGMIHLLEKEGYTVVPYTSEQTEYASAQKELLDDTFVAPTLSRKRTDDDFISIESFDELRGFSASNQTFIMVPEMTNGAYLMMYRINTFPYLPITPEETEEINLEYIENFLYEDIPGEIVSKEKITSPYPGFDILNKTKKGDYQRYRIYETPLELLIIKLGGKQGYVKQYGDSIFNTLEIKQVTTGMEEFNSPNKGFKVIFPKYRTATNVSLAGKKLLQGKSDGITYFLQETVVNSTNYIEDDKFEAQFIVEEFAQNQKLQLKDGYLSKNPYQSYTALAQDTINNTAMYLHSVMRNNKYYLLGATTTDKKTADAYFNSLEFNTPKYEKFETVVDTALYFTVKSPVDAPYRKSNSYDRPKAHESLEKSTTYYTPANEFIRVKMEKFHDLQMYKDAQEMWEDYNNDLADNYSFEELGATLKDSITSQNNDLYTYSRTYTDSSSAKILKYKNIYYKGRIYEIKTVYDTIQEPSEFISNFFETFTPKDTLLGKDVFVDKVDIFFNAVKSRDTLAFVSNELLRFNKKHIDQLIEWIPTVKADEKNFKSERNDAIKQLMALQEEDDRVLPFIEYLYELSYDQPDVQSLILNELMRTETRKGQKILLGLLEKDLPLSTSYQDNFLRRNDRNLVLRKELFPELFKYASISEYKEPVYELLAKLKDSGLMKVKQYKRYRDQIITDGKIDIKRNLSASSSYGSTSNLLPYAKLIFPFREERNAKIFFEKLIKSKNDKVLSYYYLELLKNNESIPAELEEYKNTDADFEAVIIRKGARYGVKPYNNLNDQEIARATLLGRINIEKKKDSMFFLKKEIIKTDLDEEVSVYFFKLIKENTYKDKEYVMYAAYLPEKDREYKTETYDESSSNGISITPTRDEEDIINKVTKKLKHLTRGRVPRIGGRY